ncbi:response regulator [Sporosarcina sp. G11-34]|uniref:response regulator n=1 Tax=Sporosarcina sp. G11-34 TaxID=2849605 RepID=UPI0022A9D3DE|nr:response regulator [Sporosarcina sp. G11-34]MCZ2257514.1 response regulator [Sporosarcina sp. G11-34]
MKNLLIVDDQAGIRLLLEEIFRKEGYKIRLASNGLKALQEVENELPDCILMDLNMPGIDGIEVLKRLKASWSGIPVVMMTAYGETELIDEALDLGAQKFFTKPFDIYKVRDAINEILVN